MKKEGTDAGGFRVICNATGYMGGSRGRGGGNRVSGLPTGIARLLIFAMLKFSVRSAHDHGMAGNTLKIQVSRQYVRTQFCGRIPEDRGYTDHDQFLQEKFPGLSWYIIPACLHRDKPG